MKHFTLREITDKIYFNTKLVNGGTATDDALKNYYISQFKYFKDIIHIIDLDDEIEYLKQSDSYSFAEVDVEFWIEMLMEYTGKFVPLRRADFKATENAFIVRIYEGVIDTFRNCDVPTEVLPQVAYKMNNRLNYPVCKQCTIIEDMQNRWNELIRKRLDTFTLSIWELERCQWLIAVESKEQEMDFSFLMPVDELLKKAMDEQKEDWESDRRMSCSQHVELPQIDIQKLYKQLEKFSGL